jgi:hypothetical protein
MNTASRSRRAGAATGLMCAFVREPAFPGSGVTSTTAAAGVEGSQHCDLAQPHASVTTMGCRSVWPVTSAWRPP